VETLFYMFFAMPRDSFQVSAAQELYRREWRWHADLRLWLKPRSPQEQMQSHPGVQYVYFDPSAWEARLFTNTTRTPLATGFLSGPPLSLSSSGLPHSPLPSQRMIFVASPSPRAAPPCLQPHLTRIPNGASVSLFLCQAPPSTSQAARCLPARGTWRRRRGTMSGWIVNTPPCLYDSLLLPSLYPTPPPSPSALLPVLYSNNQPPSLNSPHPVSLVLLNCLARGVRVSHSPHREARGIIVISRGGRAEERLALEKES
jgi:hypothetical protein